MNKLQQFSLTASGDHLRVDGVLNFTTAAQMSGQLRECIDTLPDHFTVDLAGLVDFNSAVLVFMLECVRMSAQSDKHLRFSGASPGLINMLKMASLENLTQPTDTASA